jgi:hypothetical protein
MNPLLSQCPVCGDALLVTRLYCRGCDTAIEGRFAAGPFGRLSVEQLAFVETFVRCEGRLNRMEAELGLSYPTVRARLHDVIRALGYEPGGEEPTRVPDAERRQVLGELEQGTISAEEAIRRLQGREE